MPIPPWARTPATPDIPSVVSFEEDIYVYQGLGGTRATGYEVLYRARGSPAMPWSQPKAPFVLAQEQIQLAGLPATLRTGIPKHAGFCQIYGGVDDGGRNTVAFQRGPVSVLLTTNALTPAQLFNYTAQNFCRKANR